MSQYNSLILEHSAHCLTVTINRPEALNALNKQVFDDLDHLFSEYIPSHPEFRGVIITGSGNKAFVAGADIKEFSSFSAAQGEALSRRGMSVFDKIERSPIPVIAAVNGFSLGGGCELAMACHMRIAGEHARFGQPEVNLGLTPGYGGTQRLIRLVGRSVGTELLLTARMINAEEAHRIKLVNKVVPSGTEVAAAREMIDLIAGKAPIAIAKTLECIQAYYDKSEDGFDTESRLFGECMETEDFKEGATAFIEKRQAIFQNK